MYLLNLTDSVLNIRLNKTSLYVKPFSISDQFACSPKTFKSFLAEPNHQNRYRFVMDASERMMLNSIPCLGALLISMDEAKDTSADLKSGKLLPQLDIRGKVIEPADKVTEKRISAPAVETAEVRKVGGQVAEEPEKVAESPAEEVKESSKKHK